MPVCRYYQKGNCRFGKNCRFDHIDPTSEGRGISVMNRDNSRSGYDSGNYDSYNNPYKWSREQNRSPQGMSPMVSYGQPYHGNNRDYRASSPQYYDNNKESYYYEDEYNPGPSNRQGEHPGRSQDNRYSQMYGREQDYNKYHYSRDKDRNYSRGTDKHVKDLYQCISGDYEVMENCQIWMLTSYGPDKLHGSLAGWYDHSPEELRSAAYKAKEQQKGDQYKDALASIVKQAKEQRLIFKSLSKAATDAIKQYMNQSPGTIHPCPDSAGLGSTHFSPGPSVTGSALKPPLADTEMDAMSVSFASVPLNPPPQNLFGSVPPYPGSQASQRSPEEIFGFTDLDIDYKLLSFMWKGHTPYSKMQDFSEEQISQFKAAQFTPGNVPLLPPPRDVV